MQEVEQSSLKYVYVHKCVRNDNHCPTCRMHYVSVHANESVALEKMPEDQQFVNEPVWVDEWVRRSNGDRYQVFQSRVGGNYDLAEHDVNDSFSGLYQSGEICCVSYMLVNIKIDKDKWCPNNITFNIEFFETFKNAFTKMIERFKLEVEYDDEDLSDNEDDNYDDGTNEENIGNIYDENKNTKICVRKRSKKIFNFFKIVKLEDNTEYCINEMFSQLSTEKW